MVSCTETALAAKQLGSTHKIFVIKYHQCITIYNAMFTGFTTWVLKFLSFNTHVVKRYCYWNNYIYRTYMYLRTVIHSHKKKVSLPHNYMLIHYIDHLLAVFNLNCCKKWIVDIKKKQSLFKENLINLSVVSLKQSFLYQQNKCDSCQVFEVICVWYWPRALSMFSIVAPPTFLYILTRKRTYKYP